MNEVIILTKDRKDGEKLRNSLTKFDSNLKVVPCFVKEDVIGNPEKTRNTISIFSTWYMPEFMDYEVIKCFPNLKYLYYAAGSIKYFAPSFMKHGVRVFSGAIANAIPVAEFVASQIILSNKGYYQAQRSYKWPIGKRGYKKSRSYTENKQGNYEGIVGLIGCGAVGSHVVHLLQPYKLKIVVYDPYLTDKRIEDLGVIKMELNKLFSICDVISNHLPDTTESKSMIDYRLLSSMKKTATFINTGRGRQVVEKDLSKVLHQNSQMCALLDVTTHEPLWPWSSLYWRKNVFLTPHIAGSMSNEYLRMVELMLKAMEDVRLGKPNANEVYLEQLVSQA